MDDNGPNESNVKVAVRVRPMNRRGKCTFHVIVHFSVVAAQSLVSPPVKSVLLLSVREQQLGRAFKSGSLAVSFL